jgi:hypothetical protein
MTVPAFSRPSPPTASECTPLLVPEPVPEPVPDSLLCPASLIVGRWHTHCSEQPRGFQMLISLFFLAAAADSIAYAGGRVVRAITMLLRPSSVLIATTLLLGTLGYWIFRSAGSETEHADRILDPKLPTATASGN